MSDDAARHGAGGLPALDTVSSPGEPGRKIRKRRGPTPAELALLRWLAAKPRPVTMGPIGNCVKRGWCEPVRTTVEDDDGRRLGFNYVVTEAGSRLIAQHGPDGRVDGPRSAAEAVAADGDESGDAEMGPRRSPPAADPERR